MSLLETLLIVTILSIACGSLSMLLSFCFEKGNIFDFWLPFVARTLSYNSSSELEKEIEDCNNINCINYVLTEYAYKNIPLYKPLGGCVICMNVWLTLIAFTLLTLMFPINLFYVFLSVPLSHATVSFLANNR